jgi:hypothetical protein
VRDYEKSRAFSLFSPFSATNWHPPDSRVQLPDHAPHVSFFCRHYNQVIEDDPVPGGRGPRRRSGRNASRCENDLWLLNDIWVPWFLIQMGLSFPSPYYEWRFVALGQPVETQAGAAEFGIAIDHSHAPSSGFDINVPVTLACIWGA